MKLVKRNVTDVFVLSDPKFRVSMQKQEKTIFLYYFVLIKGIYEIVQANNIYLQKEETMTFHLIIINTLTCFLHWKYGIIQSRCSEGWKQQLGKYAPYDNLTLLLWLLRINSQITLDHLLYPCSGKTSKVVFALSDPMFRVYM